MEFLSDLTLWHYIGVAIAVALSVIALRVVFTFSFDVNKWQETRKKKQLIKFQNKCPHLALRKNEDGEVEIFGLITSPPGTMYWICSQCGFRTTDERYVDAILQDRLEKVMNKRSVRKHTE